jgi:hypothetical protein
MFARGDNALIAGFDWSLLQMGVTGVSGLG